ncbi:MAG: hypothetical protein ACOC3V_04695 [bacterium]
MNQYEKELTDELKRYWIFLKESANKLKNSGEAELQKDYMRRIIGKDDFFIKSVMYTPNKFMRYTQGISEKIQNRLDQLQIDLEDAWDRVKQASKEDWWSDLESQYENEDGEIDYDTIERKTGWSDVDDISDEDLFNGSYYNKGHFINFASQEISHNIDGRYPYWDKYIRPWFDIKKMNKEFSGAEDTWHSIDLTIENLQNALEEAKSWMLSKLKIIIKDCQRNKKEYIKSIFGKYEFEWLESKSVFNKLI